MPPEITALAPPWVVGIFVVVVICLHIGRMLAEASETWAKVLGPLGRRWRERGVRRRRERLEERDARQADLEDMTRQRDRLAAALQECRTDQDQLYAYLNYDTGWHRKTRLAAADTGCNLPPHTTFIQWKDQD